MDAIDLHQHLWPEPFVELLRRRTRAPYLRGWTAGHRRRAGRTTCARTTTTWTAGSRWTAGPGSAWPASASPPRSASSPCRAPRRRRSSTPGTRARSTCPPTSRPGRRCRPPSPTSSAWPDLLDGPFVGVQLPATELVTPAGWDALGDVLRVAELSGKPVLRAPRTLLARGRRAVLVVARRRVRRAAAGRLVGLARLRTAARSSRGSASSSRPVPGWRRCTTSGSPRAAATTARSTPTSSSTPRRTARRGSTPWPAPSGSTSSCSAATVRTPSPLQQVLGEAATQVVRVDNPRRALGPLPLLGTAPTTTPEEMEAVA